MGENLGEAIDRHLKELEKLSATKLVDNRYARFRKLGILEDSLRGAQIENSKNNVPKTASKNGSAPDAKHAAKNGAHS